MLSGIGLAALMWMLPQPHYDAPSAKADPAIYVIRDHDTTVYLFGTLHVLSPGLDWLDGPVGDAFAESDELIVETVPADVVARASLPAPVERMTSAASFLATTQDAVRAGQSRGMALENGADMVLLRAASADGKLIEPLETLESQFVMIAKIPAEATPAPMRNGSQLDSGGRELSDTMAQLEDAWANGEHGLFSDMLDEMEASAPDAYRVLFVERNARWSDWVAGRMRQPGKAFVAIGAAHLAGNDSLLVRLAQRGLISRRLR